MICYYGKHYVSLFVRRTQDPTSRSYGEWLLFDDATIRVLGSWCDVKRHCVAAHYQPTVVWFEQVPTGEAPWWADDDDDGGIGGFFNNMGSFLSDSITDLGKPMLRPVAAQPAERATMATNNLSSMATATRQPAGNARELPQIPPPPAPLPPPPPSYSTRATVTTAASSRNSSDGIGSYANRLWEVGTNDYRSRNPAHDDDETISMRLEKADLGLAESATTALSPPIFPNSAKF
jgi:hypothetical protein